MYKGGYTSFLSSFQNVTENEYSIMSQTWYLKWFWWFSFDKLQKHSSERKLRIRFENYKLDLGDKITNLKRGKFVHLSTP